MTEQRLDTIEFKLAHQEDLLTDLERLVIDQQRTIDRLKVTVQQLSGKLKDLGEQQGSGDINFEPANEIPPHY